MQVMDHQDVLVGCVGITARTHGFQFIGVESVCHVVTSNVYRSNAVGFRPWIFPFRRGWRRGTRATGTSCYHPDGDHGFVASTDWPGRSRAGYRISLSWLSGLFRMLSETVRLSICSRPRWLASCHVQREKSSFVYMIVPIWWNFLGTVILIISPGPQFWATKYFYIGSCIYVACLV